MEREIGGVLSGIAAASLAAGIVWFFSGCEGNTIRDYKMQDIPKYKADLVNDKDAVEIVVRNSVDLRDKTFIVFFDFNKADLTESSKAELDKIRELPEGRIVEIKGHTDVVGSDVYNYELGQKRAKAVAEYLNSKDTNIYSFGKTKATKQECTVKNKECGKIDRKAVVEYLY